MTRDWGRFSVRGDSQFEASMKSLFDSISEEAQAILPSSVCRAMVLLGGYGRGEGGVVVDNGHQRPHNNFDFLVITKSLSNEEQQQLKTRLQEALSPLAQEYGVEFDFAVMRESTLRRAPSLVMWYDMRFAHKTVVGDAEFVPSLARFSVERIPSWDILNLLSNRGTLFVINDHLLANRELHASDRKRVVKHTMKAIIGYGDALLFFSGRYDWSYAEKQKRMQGFEEAPKPFRALYDSAIAFRFAPDYGPYLDRDLSAWMNELRSELSSIHLLCERKRLGCRELAWGNYTEQFFRRGIWDDSGSARSWAKKAVYLLRSEGKAPEGHSYAAGIGYRALGTRGILPALFPVAAYHLEDARYRHWAASAVGAANTEINEVRRAYLYKWGSVVEPNFLQLAKKWGLALAPGGGA